MKGTATPEFHSQLAAIGAGLFQDTLDRLT
jgi:hypothetical protein